MCHLMCGTALHTINSLPGSLLNFRVTILTEFHFTERHPLIHINPSDGRHTTVFIPCLLVNKTLIYLLTKFGPPVSFLKRLILALKLM